VEDGDPIELDVPARRLVLEVPEEELARRRAAWRPRELPYARGWVALYARHIRQADKGCDFDVLEGTASLPEPAIH
jgi:dihydroxy-acid dehydratase